ncbi:MAG: hypothetical protein K0S01_605 [Herbinix sp.]|jgi:hypothetical protein|nr:hypothetical protein [Herbinix sp.]
MGVDFDNIRLNIKKESYDLIGTGSGRRVFDLNNGYVVKMAKNRKGIAQNKVEYQISSTAHTKIFAKVLAVSDDFIYLIMEKAEKINYISDVWKYYHVRNNRELFRLNEFRNLTSKYGLLLPDLCRPYSWGLIGGRPTIIDFGFTKEVRRRYYSLF